MTTPQAAAIHLWIWRIDPAAPYPASALNAPERARAARFVRPADRVAHAAAHAGMRVILGACLEVPATELAFDAAALGKPFLAMPTGTGWHFNLSHSGGLAALGLARFPIGVDIEAMRPIEHDVAQTVFSAMELAELDALPPEAWQSGFFRAWTRKEAFVKALGSGLSAPLDRFSVSLSPAEPAQLREVGWAPDEAAHWHLAHFDAGERHVGAVAARRRNWQLVRAEPAAIRHLGLAPVE